MSFDSEKFFKDIPRRLPHGTDVDTAIKHASIFYSDDNDDVMFGSSFKYFAKNIEENIEKNKKESEEYNNYITKQLIDSGFNPEIKNMKQIRILLSVGGKANKDLGYNNVYDISQKCLKYIPKFTNFNNNTIAKLYNKAINIAYGRMKLVPIEIMLGMVTTDFEIIIDSYKDDVEPSITDTVEINEEDNKTPLINYILLFLITCLAIIIFHFS